jgi:hypothetical protein
MVRNINSMQPMKWDNIHPRGLGASFWVEEGGFENFLDLGILNVFPISQCFLMMFQCIFKVVPIITKIISYPLLEALLLKPTP